MHAFTFFGPNPAIAHVVEAIWDIDLPDAGKAPAFTFKVLPSVSSAFCLHYRSPTATDQWTNSHCLQRVAGIQTGPVSLRADGPVGAIIVHLKPEAAYRVIGGCMDEFTDTSIGLRDLFGATQTALLEEMLGEAANATARAAYVQKFLISHLREDAPDAVVKHAVLRLCRDPALRLRRLASSLEISERQLTRRFHALVGTTPKQFARIARIGKAVAARRRGAGWAEIAYACGFHDQAHLVNDFKTMMQSPPDALFGAASIAQFRDFNASLATSGFYNTFVV